ncbi:MAG TPA: nucleotidyltransferase, partial [Rhizobium sp.]|nr:nucleotidyltransferase [Rhizobium sp.]
MPRVVSLFLPRWPTDRLRRKSPDDLPPRDGPLVLVGRLGSRRIISALDLAAEKAGLRRGMAITKAQALVSNLTLQNEDPAADEQGLHRLALWALQHVCPIVAVDGLDGLVLDTTGTDHLHGGEAALVQG